MLPERIKKDMATMDRIFSLYSERFGSSLEDRFEWGSVFMLSYKTEQMRKNVVTAEIPGN